MAHPAAAAGSNTQGTVVQSYNAGSGVLPAMLVRAQPKNPNTVIPLAANDVGYMLGVVVPTNNAPIVLTPQSATAQQILVAGSGRYNLLVSNQNGVVTSGDYLGVSAIPGIAMRAGSSQAQVIGRAAGNFDGRSNVIGTESLRGSLSGITVSIGYIPADIQFGPNPLLHHNNNLPGFLTKAADSIANKSVSKIRIYFSIAVLLVTLYIAGSLFYGGAHSSIVSIGRNPLAKKAISRGLVQMILIGLITLVVGVVGVYLILDL